MPFIGNKPSAVPLTSADIADSVITSAKIVDGTIVNADINASAAIAGTKLSGVGKVLQVITATDSTQRTTTSTSFVTASNTLSLSITPSSASNKIFLIASLNGSSSSDYAGIFTVYRNSTNVAADNFMKCASTTAANGATPRASCTFSVLDSPSLTSAITYQIYFKTEGGGSSARINIDTSTSTLTAFEIAG
jgi:hypothetical protein